MKSFSLTSPAFEAGGMIPALYTCEGQDVAPPLDWSDPPADTKSFALIVDDPDAPDPDAPRMTWVHWLLYNIPGDPRHLPEAVESTSLPAATLEGVNDWKRSGYGGPCPPIGRHRYFFKLCALDLEFPDLKGPTKAMVEAEMAGHILGHAELIGTYQKRETG